MNQENIKRKILETYELCGVDSFPLDCYSILQCFGFKVYSYSKIRALNSELFSMCQNFSADAFRFKNIICFNDLKPKERICFSLMHELGHYLLEHRSSQAFCEFEADCFASHILAPPLVIHLSGFRTAKDISRVFSISRSAAYHAKNNYKIWSAHSPSAADHMLYNHFFNKQFGFFIYQKKVCPLCQKPYFNSMKEICPRCIGKHKYGHLNHEDNRDNKDLIAAEYQWLYDF